MTVAVSLDGVSKSFRGNPVLRGANADFEWGQSTAVIGPNGSGKTVLLRMISGFIRPDRGTVSYDSALIGTPPRRFPSKTGVVFDSPAYVGSWTVSQNLERLAAIIGRASTADIDNVIEALDLAPYRDVAARRLSLGTRQRLALAQAMFEDQRLLVLDEAFNGLDEAHSRDLSSLLQEKTGDGCCVIFTSHSATDVSTLATNSFRLVDGALIQSSLASSIDS